MESSQNLVTCVCTGNICRSPMAERLLAHALAAEEEPLKSLKVISTGVSAWDGDPPSHNSVLALKKVGLNLANHRSQRMSADIMENSVLVLGMTDMHKFMVEEAYPHSDTPVILMREKMPAPADPQVPDPYGADYMTYEETRDAIMEAIPSVISYLKELLEAKQ